jgi:hypothetical protein
MASIIEPNDIYVIFDKKGQNLKGVGLMDSATTITENSFLKAPITNDEAKKSKFLNYSLNSLISNAIALAVNDPVLVKVEKDGITKYLPGKVSAIVAPNDVNVELYACKHNTRELSDNLIKITEIPSSNIIKNIQVNEQYSIGTVNKKFEVSYMVKTTDTASITETYTDFINKIIVSDEVITINGVGMSVIETLTFTTIPILTSDGTDYLIKGTGIAVIGKNDRIPYYYTVVDKFTDPKDSNKTIPVVRGGKKSKDKTRKNTMPLQFAPGAKRSYLKRRKSSRK